MDLTANKKYRDRVFRHLFGSPDRKEDLLSLYNVLNNTDYNNVDDLELFTLEDVIFMNMKNDVSLIIDGRLSLYEHQSTINPNMPLRGLCYFARMYERYREEHHFNIYSSSLFRIPTPQYYVFYNGKENAPDRTLLRLSSAFIHEVNDGEFEWTATMLNVNYGHNAELMERCGTLREYSILVDQVETNRKTQSIEIAIKNAVEWCINNDVLTDYLRTHRSEVVAMMLTEYNEEETMLMFKEEYLEQGRAEEHAKDIVTTVDALIANMDWSLEQACKALNFSIEEYNSAKNAGNL